MVTMTVMMICMNWGQRCWVLIRMMMRETYSLVLFCNPDSFLVIVQCLPVVALEISLRRLHKQGRERIGRMEGWNRTLNVSVKHLGYFSNTLNTSMHPPVYSYPVLSLSALYLPQLAAGKRTSCDKHMTATCRKGDIV